MELFITSAACVVVGLATGQFVSISFKNNKSDPTEIRRRIEAIETVIPDLIPRAEVQDAISKVPPLVAQMVQNAPLPSVQMQSPMMAPPEVPAMNPVIGQMNMANNAKAKELEQRISQLGLEGIETLSKQMPKRSRKPRQ
tara:strand:- start:14890 stop:15309 length:420 start_codon:yes stop_codon:yes gene_type:complete